jgi:hypothetical protein
MAVQFRNVNLKSVTAVQLSNNPAGIEARLAHPLNTEVEDVTAVQFSNNPAGIAARLVQLLNV